MAPIPPLDFAGRSRHCVGRTVDSRRQNLLTGVVLALVVGAGAWLRFHAIGAKPVWLDESFSIWLANQGVTDALRWMVKVDQHPPLYYLLLHFWQRLFGDLQGTVRGLSAVLGVLAIPVFFLAIRRLVDRPTAVIASVILAFAPFHVRFAQETRMYALLTLLAAAAIYCLARVLTERSASRWPWIGLVLAQAGVMLTHNTAAAFFPLALNLPILGVAFYYRSRPDACPWAGMAQPGFIRRWLMAQALAILCWLPWSYPFFIQSHRVYEEFWIGAPTGRSVRRAFEMFNYAHLARDFPGRDYWMYLYWGLALLGLVWLLRVPALGLLFLSLFGTAIVGELLVSLKRPIFYDRTLIWTTLAYYALMAAGIRSLGGIAMAPGSRRRRWLVVVAQAVLLACMLRLQLAAATYYFEKYRKEDWASGAEFVATHAAPGDLVVFNATWVQIPFEYYYRHHRMPVVMKGLPVDLFDRGILEPKMAVEDVPYMVELLKGRDRLWLVYSHDSYTDPEQIIIRSLKYVMTQAEYQELAGLDLYRFERRKREWDADDLRVYLAVRRPHEFSFECPEAKRVTVAGTFNAWNSQEYPMARDTAGVWRITVEMPLGDHEYEFKIDDSRWTEDPKNSRKRATPFGYNTSLLTIEEDGLAR